MTKYTFENFIRSDSNWFAYDIFQQIARNGTCPYSPLILVGEAQTGKTHLLKALWNSFRMKQRDVVYATSNEMTNYIISLLQTGAIDRFPERYDFSDLLLIDDLHEICGKAYTQSELCQLIRSMTHKGKIVVISSSRDPSEIITDVSLLEVLETGLMLQIAPPNAEIRIVLARQLAAEKQLDLSDDLHQQIADGCCTYKDIQHTVARIKTFSDICKVPPTFPLIDKILKGQGDYPDVVIDQVCRWFSLRPAYLMRSRSTGLVKQARAIAAYILRQNTSLSLIDIARYFQADHSTILLDIRRIEKALRSGDGTLIEAMEGIERNILESVQ